MNKQKLFDTVVKGLLAQGMPSIDTHNLECKYRGPGGTKCAAGQIIPDEDYDPSWEGNSVTGVVWFIENLPERYLPFLNLMQEAHDLSEGDFWKDFDQVDSLNRDELITDPAKWLPLWKNRMKKIARAYNVRMGELNK